MKQLELMSYLEQPEERRGEESNDEAMWVGWTTQHQLWSDLHLVDLLAGAAYQTQPAGSVRLTRLSYEF